MYFCNAVYSSVIVGVNTRVNCSLNTDAYPDPRCCQVPATTCATSIFSHSQFRGCPHHRDFRLYCSRAYLSAPSSWSFSPKLTRGADIVNSDAQINGRGDGGVEIDAKAAKKRSFRSKSGRAGLKVRPAAKTSSGACPQFLIHSPGIFRCNTKRLVPPFARFSLL